MTELMSLLKYFITRDIIFSVGGCMVLAAFCYSFDVRWQLEKIDTLVYVFVGGVGHFVGLALMSLGHLARIVTVGASKSPGRLQRGVFRWWTGAPWRSDASNDTDYRFEQVAGDRERAELDRIITLKHVGATMAPCCIVVAALLGIRLIRAPAVTPTLDVALLVAVVALAPVFVVISWYMAAQQTAFVVAKSNVPLASKVPGAPGEQAITASVQVVHPTNGE